MRISGRHSKGERPCCLDTLADVSSAGTGSELASLPQARPLKKNSNSKMVTEVKVLKSKVHRLEREIGTVVG